jgi:hypothetical protein
MFADMTASIEYIRAGKLRPLAVATATRWGVPYLPTVGDFVPVYEASSVCGRRRIGRIRGLLGRLKPRRSCVSARRDRGGRRGGRASGARP